MGARLEELEGECKLLMNDSLREFGGKCYRAGIGEMVELTSRLLKAAKAGECPDADCPICKEKRKTISEAETKLKEGGINEK